jgi:hypothetical protein
MKKYKVTMATRSVKLYLALALTTDLRRGGPWQHQTKELGRQQGKPKEQTFSDEI